MKDCPLGDKCNRKNPIHFGEFSHVHLDAIYDKGPKLGTNQYEIPSDLCSELITIQLRLLEKVRPKPKQGAIETPSSTSIETKISQVDAPSSSNSKNEKVSTSSINVQHGAPAAKRPKITHDINQYIPVVVEKGKMAKKLEKAAPYNFFLTTVTDSRHTHYEPLSVTLQEILDESLGELECSVQINYTIDIGWLLGHYYFAGVLDKPLLVLYGAETTELATISLHKPQVTAIKVQMSTPFATAHTKMMLLGYTDGSARVVISSANLYADDWHNRAQGIWISPKLIALPDEADKTAGESPTGFKASLLSYLNEYKFDALAPWLKRLEKTDFSIVNVFFIGSVPGSHRPHSTNGHPWGHARLGHLLEQHVPSDVIDATTPIVCQSSTIGSLGADVSAWIEKDILSSLRKSTETNGMPPFKLIFPSLKNVRQSHDGIIGGGCCLYGKSTNDKQPWLKAHLYQWKSDIRHRTKSMPHIKTYARFNLEQQCLYWFVLSSANLSKSAWGIFNKNGTLRISNYEAGVLFLPGFMIGENSFPLFNSRDGMPPFPLPYDLPLTPYDDDDQPFVMDFLMNGS